MRTTKSTKKPSKKELYDAGQDEMNKIQQGKSLKSVFTKQTLAQSPIQLTPKQNELYKLIRTSTFTIVQGPAGTSKTMSACYTALSLLADGKVNKIVITKPIVEASASMGFLPGSMEEKIQPYMKSYYHNFEKILGKFVFEQLLTTGVIVIEVLNFMRGDTFDNAILLLDEAQNCEMTDLILWITRMGKTSKAVMMGDVSQYDIDKRDAKFLTFIDILADVEDVKNFEFTPDDIMRHELLKKIVDRYEKWKYAGDKDKKMIKS